jgi:hypothetical protein
MAARSKAFLLTCTRATRFAPPDDFRTVHFCPQRSGLNDVRIGSCLTQIVQLRGKNIEVEREFSSEKGLLRAPHGTRD